LFQIVSSFLTFTFHKVMWSTPLRCDGTLSVHYTISPESEGEKILKIGQHFLKLWAVK